MLISLDTLTTSKQSVIPKTQYDASRERNPPVVFKSLEQAVEALRNFLVAPTGSYHSTTWGMVMEDRDEYIFYPRQSQPCYGEMRPYGADGIRRPTDLKDPFPETGNPVAIGVHWPINQNDIYAASVSKDSPWYHATKNAELLYDKNKNIKGVIIHDTKNHSDLIVNYFLSMRHIQGFYIQKYTRAGYRFDIACLLTGAAPGDKLLLSFVSYSIGSYIYGINFKRWLNKDPDVVPDWNFYDRKPYHRPYIERIWFSKEVAESAKTLLPSLKCYKALVDKKLDDKMIRELADEFETYRTVCC